MQGDQPVLTETRESVCYLTLNRPEKLNAFNYEMRRELVHALKVAERTKDVNCVVIRGAGRAFSAGVDLTPSVPPVHSPENGYFNDQLDDIVGAYAHDIMETWWTVWSLLKPVIAQVHGYCLAAASELASLCDLMIVSSDAVLGYPPIRAQSPPETMYLPWKLPMSRAKYLLFTGRPISGQEAAEWGWATLAFPPERLETETARLAQGIASIAVDELAMLKRSINRSYEIMGMRTALEVGADTQALSRYRPSAGDFNKMAKEMGLKAALQWRDQAFGDYSASEST